MRVLNNQEVKTVGGGEQWWEILAAVVTWPSWVLGEVTKVAVERNSRRN